MLVTLKPLANAEKVPIGGGFNVESPVEITASGDDLPYDVTLITEVDQERIVVMSLLALRKRGGPPVNGTGLRKIAVDRLLAEAFAAGLWRTPLYDFTHGNPGPIAEYVKAYEGTPGDVALATYRLALAVGAPPVLAVAESLSITPAAARGMIARMRKLGWLPPTVKGKAKG